MSLLQRLSKYLRQEFDAHASIEPIAKRLVLEELRRALLSQLSAIESLDNKLRQLLSSASLILSVVTTLQITTGIQRIGWVYLSGLIVAFVLYVGLIVVIILAMRPAVCNAPIPSTWEEIDQRYFGEEENVALSVLIRTYIKTLDDNDKPMAYKALMVKIASILFIAIVFALLLMGIVGLGSHLWMPPQSPLNTPTPTP